MILEKKIYLLRAKGKCGEGTRSCQPDMRTAVISLLLVLISLQPSPQAAFAAKGGTRRTSRVGQVVQAELATVIRQGNVRGKQKCPAGLEQMISIVDVDMSPDLRNARVKVSVIGQRRDKVSAVRWLRTNVRGFRHALAQRNRQMKRVPMLTFDHVDVGAATDMMVKLADLRQEREAAEAKRRANGERVPDEEGGLDFAARDEEAFDDEEDFDLDEDDVWASEEAALGEEGEAGEDEDEEDWDLDDEEDDALEAAWEAEMRGKSDADGSS